MEADKRSNAAGSAALSWRVPDDAQLTSKDKRYIQSVDKVLSTFDSLDEWADYIAFLSKLHKSLQLSEDSSSKHALKWIPNSSSVAGRLALCLSSRLPNGVHQKALSLYESIFKNLNIKSFNDEVSIWLPGLFPLLSYCSIQVKPQLIKILREDVLATLSAQSLNLITKPLILSLLPGLDDENSEVFVDVLQLMDDFKVKLEDDSHFWQSMFLCVISNPEKRLGALAWCSRRLPVIASIRNSKENQYSEEARACLAPEPGLLIRAFARSISGTTSSINSASDIIVIRGFFDLLMSHLPLDSAAFEGLVSSKDKQLLIMSCCRITLKRDMSLNRRLWNYFLGPENESEAASRIDRSVYFENYVLESLTEGFLKMIKTPNLNKKIEAFKISLSIIMDKWEISKLVTPRLFSPFLQTCFEYRSKQEILIAAQMFFDGIESSYIWSYIVNILNSTDENNLGLLEFMLNTFNFNEEDMMTIHAPLAIICGLSETVLTNERLSILETLLNLVPSRAYTTLGPQNYNFTSQTLIDQVTKFYEVSLNGDPTQKPFNDNVNTYLIIELVKDAVIRNINNDEKSYRLSSLLAGLLYTIPKNHENEWKSEGLVNSILSLPKSSFQEEYSKLRSNALIALGMTKIFGYVAPSVSSSTKEAILRLIMTNLWFSIYSTQPGCYQFEAVKAIHDLEITCSSDKIEAGLVQLMMQTPQMNRIQAFSNLWIHSSSMSEGDAILSRSLQLVLNETETRTSSNGMVDFIQNTVVKNGTTNKLLKMITSPLLDFEVMLSSRTNLRSDDDLSRFAYYLQTILNVCKASPKALKEAFSHELAVMDSGFKLSLIKSNGWDISTYKSLLCSIISKFIKMKLSKPLATDEEFLNTYLDSASKCFDLLKLLVTGNEAEFSETFYMLIESCSYCSILIDNSYLIELIQTSYLDCIFHFLELSEDLKINLNLLHVEDESKDSVLVKFMIEGITRSKTALLLESWLKLLTRSLYLFNESIFSVLFTLNDCIIKKVESYFMTLKHQDKFDDLVDVESSVNTLITGLESLLSISHSFLLASSVKYNDDRTQLNNETGFFGSVIQGVFSIESPAIRNSEQNKLFSILLSFQDAVKMCFKLWQWADSRPSELSAKEDTGKKTQIYLAQKIKFRARKMLESLLDLEKREVIETLVSVDDEEHSGIKLLNILDGGRSQVTLPFLFDSIYSRCYPQIVVESKRSTLNIPITEKELSNFLVHYFESIDNDTISDMWALTVQFFKNVLAYSTRFKAIVPDCLKAIKVLSVKMVSSGSRDKVKNRREMSEIFVKMLTNLVVGKSNNLDFSESEIISEDEGDQDLGITNSSLLQDETLDALVLVLEHLDTIIEDSEKASASLDVIIANLITPQIKSKKVSEVSFRTLAIMDLIGKYNPNKTWKNLVSDSFMDNSFFNVSTNKLRSWSSIISTWVSIEKDKMHDLILRITPLVSTSSSNLFTWNESSEIENKIQSLKRITYLILIQPVDFFLSHLDELFGRLEDALNVACPPAYKSEIMILLRSLTLKVDELHLLPRWTMICHELKSILGIVAAENGKDTQVYNADELSLILNACKLLDQLLLLGFDEFNLNEWLFVSSNSDLINGSFKSSGVALIDKIAKEKDLTILKDEPIKMEQPQEELYPLLQGVQRIESITQLRLFFQYLSLINFERTYGLLELNHEDCENDVLNDLILVT